MSCFQLFSSKPTRSWSVSQTTDALCVVRKGKGLMMKRQHKSQLKVQLN